MAAERAASERTAEVGLDRRVVVGTAMQAGARVATALLAFVIVAWLARVLDRDAFGRYGATLALFQVLDALVDSGSLAAVVRRVSSRRETARAAVAAAVQFRLVTATAAVAVTAAAAFLLDDPQPGLVTLAGCMFFSHAVGVGVAALHADIDFARSEGYRVLAAVLGLAATAALVVGGARDAGSMLLAVCVTGALSNVLLARSVRRELPAESAPIDRGAFFREAITLGLGGVIRQGYYSMNPILTRALAGDDEAARFIPAYRLSGFAILISVYAGAAAMPALVRLRLGDPAAHRAFVRRWTLGLAALGAAAGLGLFVLRRPILRLLFGEGYGDTAAVLAPMCITTAAIHVGGFAVIRLVADGRGKTALAISAAGLAANLAANLTLTPRYGAVGAAWASVATEAVVAAGALAALARRGPGTFARP